MPSSWHMGFCMARVCMPWLLTSVLTPKTPANTWMLSSNPSLLWSAFSLLYAGLLLNRNFMLQGMSSFSMLTAFRALANSQTSMLALTSPLLRSPFNASSNNLLQKYGNAGSRTPSPDLLFFACLSLGSVLLILTHLRSTTLGTLPAQCYDLVRPSCALKSGAAAFILG